MHWPESQAGLSSKGITPRTYSHITAMGQPMGMLYWCFSWLQVGAKDQVCRRHLWPTEVQRLGAHNPLLVQPLPIFSTPVFLSLVLADIKRESPHHSPFSSSLPLQEAKQTNPNPLNHLHFICPPKTPCFSAGFQQDGPAGVFQDRKNFRQQQKCVEFGLFCSLMVTFREL